MDEKISRKINILEITSVLGYAGGSRNLITFCKYLNKNLFNVFAAAYGRGGPGELVLGELNIEYVIGNFSVEKIVSFIQEKRIDVIHIHRSGGYVEVEVDILKKAKGYNPNLIIIEKNVFGKYDSLSAPLIDTSFFQSKMHLNERYLSSAPTEFDFKKMKVLYNMVDQIAFEKFQLSDQALEEYRKNLGIAPEDFVVGRVGRPDLAKWSDLILDMLPYAVKLIPSLKFIIMGVPQSRKKRILKSSLKNHVVLLEETSNQQEIHCFYQALDVLVHSSKIGECNGNTINEAFFWKKPVLVNSTPHKDNGQLEQVDHMVNGLIANYPQTYARALHYLYRNPKIRQNMGEMGYRKVILKLNPIHITQQIEKFCIETIIGQPSTLVMGLPVDFYKKIEYDPSEQDILVYKKEYQKRLGQEYGTLTKLEQITNRLYQPISFFHKVKDMLEHKLLYASRKK